MADRNPGVQSRMFVSLCVRALKGKRHELLTPNLVHVCDVHITAVARNALTQRSKGQGHTVTKTVTVTRLPVTRAATAVCCCCWRVQAGRALFNACRGTAIEYRPTCTKFSVDRSSRFSVTARTHRRDCRTTYTAMPAAMCRRG